MERQVDLAALYAGLELPSDIGSGALLGELVGQYVLVTRGHAKPWTAVKRRSCRRPARRRSAR